MKTDLNKCLYLAKDIILSMELDSINNDIMDSFEVRGWFDKFGKESYKLFDKISTDYAPSQTTLFEMAEQIQKDFESGYWELNEDGSMYHYLMPTEYGGFIDKAIEIQLADLTKIGTQTELFI